MVRFFTGRRCVAPLTLEGDDDDDCRYGNSVRKMSYLKLPRSRLRLSVLKLDGSLFDVHIERNATVAELRLAVEEVFTLSPIEGQGKISWAHVWGHFCLCFGGQKLINDKTRIRDYRMQDGDQLQFSRHVSIDYLHSKRRSKTQIVGKQHSRFSLGLDTCEESKHTAFDDQDNSEYQHKRSSPGSDTREEAGKGLGQMDSLGNQDDSCKSYQHEDQVAVCVTESKLAHFLRGLLPYSKFRGATKKSTEGKIRPSRFALGYLGQSRAIHL